VSFFRFARQLDHQQDLPILTHGFQYRSRSNLYPANPEYRRHVRRNELLFIVYRCHKPPAMSLTTLGGCSQHPRSMKISWPQPAPISQGFEAVGKARTGTAPGTHPTRCPDLGGWPELVLSSALASITIMPRRRNACSPSMDMSCMGNSLFHRDARCRSRCLKPHSGNQVDGAPV